MVSKYPQNQKTMIQAILSNKVGRSFNNSEINWRQLFKASEDSLTSTIFENLLHLPIELFWQILNNSCYHNEGLVKGNPKIIEVQFWPKWKATDSTNCRFIEPDVFIRTIDFDLIIEAKKYDDNQQYEEQWKNELQGYRNEYENDEKEVIFLAIGGIRAEEVETIMIKDKTFSIIKCRWAKLLQEVKYTLKALEKSNGYLSNVDAIIRVLNHIIEGFGIHGYMTGKWFENEDFSKLTPIVDFNESTQSLLKYNMSKTKVS